MELPHNTSARHLHNMSKGAKLTPATDTLPRAGKWTFILGSMKTGQLIEPPSMKMMWVMTDSVSSCCCFSYCNKWEDCRNRKKWRRNFCHMSGKWFYFYLSTFLHSENKQPVPPEGPWTDTLHCYVAGTVLRSWRSWHNVLNTSHRLLGAFLFITYWTEWQADAMCRLP